MDLKTFRERINAIDDTILDLLAQRRGLVREVVRLKDREKILIRDAQREEELLTRLIAKGREVGLDAHCVTKIFHEIIDDSVRSQQLFVQRRLNADTERRLIKVAYQGIDGNFSHLAAQKFFAGRGDEPTFIGCARFTDVVEAVEEGQADFGLLPVENTVSGGIQDVYDELLRMKLSIVGEEVFQVRHCLLAVDRVPLSRIRRVYSQYQALAECTRFLSQLQHCKTEPATDTAMAVRKVKDDQDLSQAAIASEEAARLYGLEILQRDIADNPENFTRFVVIAPRPVDVDPRIPAKTSLILATAHKAGALMKALTVLERHGINLTKLESRPERGTRFEYLFYIDFEGNSGEQRVRDALGELRAATSFLKMLGSYPIEARGKTKPKTRSIVASSRKVAGAGRATTADRPSVPGDTRVHVAGTFPLAGRGAKPHDSVISCRGVEIGGPEFVVIAGPCAVESEEQIQACARQVRECGGKILSGGCFKLHASPDGFPGLGFHGLEMLAQAGRCYDLPILAEVISAEDVEKVATLADMILVGSYNMQNFSLLGELGGINRPVMLQRAPSASLGEFLEAAEQVVARGNHQVILCERGIRTFETTPRNTLDLGSIPILKSLTHLPIVVDPSHAAGHRDLVLPLAIAARGVGPHGVMVEIHLDPAGALCGGNQALSFDDLRELMVRFYG